MIIIRLLCCVFILLPTCSWSTTPTIIGIAGTIATGQIVSISGSNLVDEDKTNWAIAYKTGTQYGFEGASWDADNYHASDANNISYDSTIKIMGNQSFKGRIYGTSVTWPQDNMGAYAAVYLGEDGFNEQQRADFYVRMYSRWHTSGAGDLWPKSHIKMLDVQGAGYQMYFQPSASASGATLPSTVNMVYDGTNHDYSVANFLQQDRWYVMEARFKRSSPANFTAWVDGVQIDSVTPINVGSDYNAVLFNIINAFSFTDLDLTNWTDGLTISTSRIYPASKIEISNNAVYGSGVVKYQEPIYLSDESVQFKVDLSGLGSGPYYLWVTNNRQERSGGVFIGPQFFMLPFSINGHPAAVRQ